VAEFLGEADAVPGVAGDGAVATVFGSLPCRDDVTGPVEVLIRPEAVALCADDGAALGAVVVERTFYGHDQLVTVELDDGLRLRSRRLGGGRWRPGDRVGVHVEGAVGVVESQLAGVTAR
jgi:iron(III) transport system ATP-binding protein